MGALGQREMTDNKIDFPSEQRFSPLNPRSVAEKTTIPAIPVASRNIRIPPSALQFL
jgi:hypothetical protein